MLCAVLPPPACLPKLVRDLGSTLVTAGCAESSLVARLTADLTCFQRRHIMRFVDQSRPYSPERHATGDTSTGTQLCICGAPVSPPVGRAHRQRKVCGGCQISPFVCFLTISADGDALRCAVTPRVPALARTRPGAETYGFGTCWGSCAPAPHICQHLRTGPLQTHNQVRSSAAWSVQVPSYGSPQSHRTLDW